ncbi:hypothetical protein CLU79DRAFT_750081 [Phycomyces nitens]|nr:hypothetical protein CLU79DRAFT_750081 [Phycomyces nitens]
MKVSFLFFFYYSSSSLYLSRTNKHHSLAQKSYISSLVFLGNIIPSLLIKSPLMPLYLNHSNIIGTTKAFY